MSEYFLEPKSSGGRRKVELDLFSYATKSVLKNALFANKSEVSKLVKSGILSLILELYASSFFTTSYSSLKATGAGIN